MKPLVAILAAACLSSAALAHTMPLSIPASDQALPLREVPRKQSPEDKALNRAVRRQLGQARGLDANGISVRSHAGVVWLTGSVTDPAQIAQAGQVAQTVPGVRSVVNKLTLRAGM